MAETAIAYGIWAAAAAAAGSAVSSARTAQKSRRASAKAQERQEQKVLATERTEAERMQRARRREVDMAGIAAARNASRRSGVNTTQLTGPQGLGTTTTMGGGAA